MACHFKVKDFERFQHYKDRAPPWIKLYNALLDDYAFGCLQDASKMHLVAIWLLASRADNRLPRDPVWLAKRISATDPVDLDALEAAGFIINIQEDTPMAQDASTPLAKCLTRERDTNEETERDLEHSAQVPRGASLKGKDRRVEVSPSDPVLQRPDDPLAAYSDTELKAFAFEFDGLDVESAICELTRWVDRKGITDLIERKNAIYGGLKKRHGKAKMHDALGGMSAPASPELLASMKAKGWDKLEIPPSLDRRPRAA